MRSLINLFKGVRRISGANRVPPSVSAGDYGIDFLVLRDEKKARKARDMENAI